MSGHKFSSHLQMNPSNTFANTGARAIGRRSFSTRVGGLTFGSAMTSADLQISGTTACDTEALYIEATGAASISAKSFINQFGM